MSVVLKSDTRPEPAVDPVWEAIIKDAHAMKAAEPLMASLIHEDILSRSGFEAALCARLAMKMAGREIKEAALRETFTHIIAAAPEIGQSARADIVAVYERDPACTSYLQPLLFFKGFLALQASRIAHRLWKDGRRPLAQFLQMRGSEVFTVDIHPGARIGKGLMIDHANGLVVGETAVIEDDVSILHAVTLGGTGKEGGDRHPKIGRGVLIGAGAKILGNIRIGEYSRIGAGSVVLHSVPRCKTAAGVPARVVGDAGCAHPSHSMDHRLLIESPDHVHDGGGI